MYLIKLAFILIFSFVFTGCAGSLKNQQYADQQLSDPFKGVNKSMYILNDRLDKAILKPVALTYNKSPNILKKGVSNFLGNLSEPSNFLNSALQLKPKKSLISLSRFTINTTFGLGGLIDLMDIMGEPEQPEDFGQTLAHWGVKPGAYLMLPFLGPSNIRDTVGFVADSIMFNPPKDLLKVSDTIPYTVMDVVDFRVDLIAADAILDKQSNKYSFIRSTYEQIRMNDVFDGFPPEEEEDF